MNFRVVLQEIDLRRAFRVIILADSAFSSLYARLNVICQDYVFDSVKRSPEPTFPEYKYSKRLEGILTFARSPLSIVIEGQQNTKIINYYH